MDEKATGEDKGEPIIADCQADTGINKITTQPIPETQPQQKIYIRPIPTTIKSKPKSYKSWFAGKEMESLIGGKLLNRIGALALIIGIGFFLKYAFDRNWISEWVRVGIGFLSGFSLILGGWYFDRRDFKIFSQGLLGAGIAVLFLSVFASFNFYHLLPQIAAFAMMSAITAFTFWLGVKYNSIAVAILGCVGGFLTPILLSTGQANEVGLFTYLVLLDIGILLVFIRKSEWQILYPLVLLGTYLIYYAWFGEYFLGTLWYESLITAGFLIIFWLMFLLVEFYYIYQGKTKNSDIFRITNVISLLIFIINLYIVFDHQFHSWMGLVFVIISAKYFALSWFSAVKDKENFMRRDILLISSLAALLLATLIQFENYAAIAFLSTEAILFIYFGLKNDLKVLKRFTLITIILSILKLIYSDLSILFSNEHYFMFFNQNVLGSLSIAIASFVICLRLKNETKPHYLQMASVYNYIWSIALVYLIFTEISHYHNYLEYISNWNNLKNMHYNYSENLVNWSNYQLIDFHRNLTSSFALMLYSIPLIYYGFLQKAKPAVFVALGSLAIGILTIVKVGYSFEPIGLYSIIFNYRFSAILIGILSTGLVLIITYKNRNFSSWMEKTGSAIFIAFILLIVILISAETNDNYVQIISNLNTNSNSSASQFIINEVHRFENIQQLSLSGIWIVYSIMMVAIGIWKRNKLLRLISIGLFGITILKVFIFDLSFLETLYRIFSFVALGLILLTVSYLYQRYKSIILEK